MTRYYQIYNPLKGKWYKINSEGDAVESKQTRFNNIPHKKMGFWDRVFIKMR